MLCAIQHPMSYISEETEMLKKICLKILKNSSDNPTQFYNEINWQEFSSSIRLDKKNTSTSLRLVLPSEQRLTVRNFDTTNEEIANITRHAQDTLTWVANEVL